ncbi:MAG: hypothetical protein ACKO3T_15730, partial [Planctomycetaceae bacterium]
MATLPVVSKADLLGVWARLRSGPGLGECAAALGFQHLTTVAAAPEIASQKQVSVPDEKRTGESEPPVQYDFPLVSPKVQLWNATDAETLARPATTFQRGNPLSDEELRIRHWHPRLAFRPLIPWRRMSTFLRRTVGTRIPGSRIDCDHLVQRLAAVRPVIEIPRLLRRTWSPRIAILLDNSREFCPFRRDVEQLLKSLTREAGKSAVAVFNVSPLDRAPALPAGIPVLTLSCMGLFSDDHRVIQWWCQLGAELAGKGHQLCALCPVPPRLIPPRIRRHWHPQAWDIGIVPGRKPRPAPASEAAGDQSARSPAVELLLNLLAPAALVEPELLRAVRRVARVQQSDVDVQAEWLIWADPDCWRSDESFGISPGEPLEWRLENRALLSLEHKAVVQDVQALIDQQHSAYSCALQLETELRSWNERSSQQQKQVLEQLQRVIDRLRQLALEPASAAGHNSGLPGWFNEMIQRLPPQICSTEQLAPLIAEGLALTDTWLQHERELPAGVAEQ